MRKLIRYLVFLSFFFENLSIHIGFYLKPYMIFGFGLLLFSKKSFAKPLINEIIFSFFIIVYASTSLYANDILLALRMSLGVLLLLFMYWVYRDYFRNNFDEDLLRNIGLVFSILSLVWFLMGAVHASELNNLNSRSFGLALDRGMYRMVGFENNTDYFNIFNLIFIIFSYCTLKNRKSKYLFVLSLVNTLLTYSLSAFFTIIFVLSIDILFFSKGLSLLKKTFIFISTFLFLLFIIYYFVNINYIFNVLKVRMSNLSTGSGRYAMWLFILELISANLFFGVGIGNIKLYTTSFFGIVNAHNTYLEIFSEGGLFVFVLFCLFLLSTFLLLFQLYKRKPETKYVLLSFIGLAVNIFFVSALIHEMFLFLLLIIFSKISSFNKSVIKIYNE